MEKDRSYGCIIIKDDHVLLERQKSNNVKDGFWNFPKGHKEGDESDLDTAIRETKEEVGLDVEIIDKDPVSTKYLIDDGTIEKTVSFYLARLTQKNKDRIAIQEEEVEEAKWVTFEEVEGLLTYEDSKKVWRKARERLKQIHGK